MPTSTSEKKTIPIILLGSTGCGKSSFVNAVVGEKVAAVGVGTQPATDEIAQYTLTDLECVLVDTPGFGFNHQHHRWEGTTDLSILQAVKTLLCTKFEEDGQWGVIFLYSNYTSKVDWEEERRTLAVFTKLAGGHSLPNLAVVMISPHKEPYPGAETGLLKDLEGRGIQPICSSSFGDVHVSHPHCGDVRTPQQIIEHVVSLVLSSKAEAYSSDDSSDDEDSIYSAGVPEVEHVSGLYGDGWGEQSQNDDAFLNPITHIHIAGGIFNDVRGNQTNNYGHPHTPQAPECQSSEQCPNEPCATAQPNLDVPCNASHSDLNDPHRPLQQNPDNAGEISPPNLSDLQQAIQQTPNDPQENLQATPNDPQHTSRSNLDEPLQGLDQEVLSGSRYGSEERLMPDKVEEPGCCKSICCGCVVM
ncbi:hypothetical protein BKA70DRAFT_1522939 [Coprinopsis sp. MPI-PUGE-AT-0042]|nr:hypothetical protein BKA70DRAFT_1522939 [Coprinopsis sp. MPI-PUGE-AT-0042]